MRADDQHMMSILYAPAGYAHMSHLPQALAYGDIDCPTLRNLWLLRQGKLSHLPPAWRSDNKTLSQMLSCWHLIPETAHLIGGYLMRNHLLKRGALIMSDPRLLAFISLPMPHGIALDPGGRTSMATTSCGLAFILSQFPELPQALRQRLLLHFPAGMSIEPLQAGKTLNHINLLRMALTYANHYY
ncbi:type III secretion protein [Enterobacter pasteurii]|uniref:type III secretion protein n=1 Tax=Enterobacter pasteurii TaxID=3029761 RepID=UPI00210BB44A|nr:type III secretion protein [Enterobacter pasteurii]